MELLLRLRNSVYALRSASNTVEVVDTENRALVLCGHLSRMVVDWHQVITRSRRRENALNHRL